MEGGDKVKYYIALTFLGLTLFAVFAKVVF